MELITLLVVFGMVLGFLYYISAPMPHDGITHRTATRIIFTIARAIDLTGVWLEWLGLCDRLIILKKLSGGKMEPRDQKYTTGVQTEDTTLNGVKVRIFTPTTMANDTNRPGIIHIHGGGWTFASVDTYSGFCRLIAYDVGAILATIDYRMAPDHPFPVPYEDCLTASKHFLQNAAQFGVNPDNIIIMGDSAGGNLAAAVTLALRDEKLSPSLKSQVLIYPIVQAVDLSLPSQQQNCNGPMISMGMIASCLAQYLLGKDGISYKTTQALLHNQHIPVEILERTASKLDRSFLPVTSRASTYPIQNEYPCDVTLWNKIKTTLLDPRFSPLLADDLSSLPPAYVFTAQFDVLRDEGIMYAERLRDAGCEVTWRHSENGYHCMMTVPPIQMQPESRRCYEEMISYIRARH